MIETFSSLLASLSPGPWDWSLGTLLTAVGLSMVALGNTIAAIAFFVKWSSTLKELRGDFEEYTSRADKRFDELKNAIHQDFSLVRGDIQTLAKRQEEWVALRQDVYNLRDRVRRLEA